LQVKYNPLAFKKLGENKSVCLIFLNPSLRTRLSTQKAAANLGMDCFVFDVGKDGWQLEFEDGVVMNANKAEHIREAAAVIGSYFDVIAIRSFPTLENREKDYAEEVFNQFTKYCGKPVINMESATLHPLQSLTDLMTIREHTKVERPKVVLTWAPHPRALPQSTVNSFAQWMNAARVDFVITHPEGYALKEEFSGSARIEYDQGKAFEGADFVYAKNWSSYESYGKVLRTDSEWMVTTDKMRLTNQGKFMHCLPVRRNVIVADDVLNSTDSIVIQQAANREYAAQTVLKKILESTHA